jgi:DNA polymerase-3 subunit beta
MVMNMEFSVSKSSFLKALAAAQRVADKTATLPILANVLIRSDGRAKLLVAATDLTVSVASEVDAKVTKEGGITVAARALFDVVKGLPGDEVTVIRKDDNWAQVKSGKAEFKIVGLADKDFPKLPDHREVSFSAIDRSVLINLIDSTLFSVSTDETRYHLSGALLEADGAITRMVSTDGHRLSLAEAKSALDMKWPAIIPRKAVAELRKALDGLDGAVEVGFEAGATAASNAHFKLGSAVLTVKLIEARFPPYDQVIPKSTDKRAEVSTSALTEALKRVSLLSPEKTHGVRLEFSKDRLRIAADNPELGEAREDLDVDHQGGNLTIGFNARYLLDVLSRISADRTVLDLAGDQDPAAVHPADGRHFLGIVMPMRI